MQKTFLILLFIVSAPYTWGQGSGRALACDKPSGTFSYVIDNKTVSFTNKVISATTWKWDFGDGDTSTSNEPTHNYRAYGSFNVCLTAFSDCSQAFFCNTITLSQPVVTAVEAIADNSLQVFPNPVKNQLVVECKGQVPQHITFVNSSGDSVSSCTWEAAQTSMSFDLTPYPAGIYILTWTTADRVQSQRIVKIN